MNTRKHTEHSPSGLALVVCALKMSLFVPDINDYGVKAADTAAATDPAAACYSWMRLR